MQYVFKHHRKKEIYTLRDKLHANKVTTSTAQLTYLNFKSMATEATSLKCNKFSQVLSSKIPTKILNCINQLQDKSW